MAHRQWQDANSLTNRGRNETFNSNQKKHEQMAKQQEIIEQKKLEIQKRLEEKKKKETEEALKKLHEDKLKEAESSRSKRNYYGYSKHKNWTGRDRPEENTPAILPTNIFSNDGSFLEQFQKISGVKVETRKRSGENPSLSGTNNGDVKEEENRQANEHTIARPEKDTVEERKQKERRWSSPEVDQASMTHQQNIQHPIQQVVQQPPIQHHMVQQHQAIQNQQRINQQPPLRPPMFPPQQMQPPMSHINMNYHSQFNPMQCGNMMLPPPMTPSSIPPPAPLNPGSIPSPSPLQPCSIPSPSPLQPYAIPPPSPLIPHSIPPPSPMVPHSIPPPSPLTPHSIPPPLPLRPQSIPPPLQRPPMFLSMVPPPPPPPPEEEKKELKTEEASNRSKPPVTTVVKPKMDIEDNVKDLFKDDEYSSSDDDEKQQTFQASRKKGVRSDSESGHDRRSLESNSDKESDVESDQKINSLSEQDSVLGQESQSGATESKSNVTRVSLYEPIVIEDTQTQFPSDTKDSSNSGEPAPAELSSEEDNLPGLRKGCGPKSTTCDNNGNRQEEVKKEPEDMFYDDLKMKPSEEVKEEKMDIIIPGLGFKEEIKMENMKQEVKSEVKGEVGIETLPVSGTAVKVEEPPVKKKRRSRWAASEDVVDVIPAPAVPSIVPTLLPAPSPIIRPPAMGPVGMVVPTALGGINTIVPPLPSVPTVNVPGMSGAMISKVTRTDTALVAYAMKAFGRTNLTDVEWKKAEDHYKINLLYQDMMRKKEELQRLQAAGKNKYEYDSDEETEGGTWEHKLRYAEMEATQLWADELTEQAKGKHHIGDFLPPDELARFMEKYEALKEGREPDLSDYKEFKLKEDNVGFQMLQKLGWTEGQGLGPDGSGIMDPVNKAMMRPENQGLGVERPDDVEADDDEYDAYRKRMMLAYRFRPNPMNNPRRPYY